MKMLQILILLFISIVVMSCSCDPDIPTNVVLDSPEKTIELLRICIKYDDVKHFYYCLAMEIQEK